MQWLYFDALECLPEDKEALTEDMCLPVSEEGLWGKRHWGQLNGRWSLSEPPPFIFCSAKTAMMDRWLYLGQTCKRSWAGRSTSW